MLDQLRVRQGQFWASKGDLCQQGWGSSLNPDADDLTAFRELYPQHRAAGLLPVASCVQAGLRRSLPSASHRKMRL